MLHVPLEKLIYQEERQVVLEAKADELLAGLGIRSTEGYPLFKLTFNSGNIESDLKDLKTPSWSETGDISYCMIPSGNLLASASGVQVLKGRSFTLLSRIQTPSLSTRVKGESNVLFHIGGLRDKDNPETGTDTPVKGLVVEVPPVVVGKGSLRVRIGDGKRILLAQSIPHDSLIFGSHKVYSLSWDGYRKDGSTPSYQLVLTVDGVKIGSIDLANGPFPDISDLTFVSFGAGLGRGSFSGWGGSQNRVGRTYVLNGVPELNVLQAFIADTF
jgi:hypothetical protein